MAQSDRDQYDYLLSIVDPGKKMGPDEEALLAVGHYYFTIVRFVMKVCAI